MFVMCVFIFHSITKSKKKEVIRQLIINIIAIIRLQVDLMLKSCESDLEIILLVCCHTLFDGHKMIGSNTQAEEFEQVLTYGLGKLPGIYQLLT